MSKSTRTFAALTLTTLLTSAIIGVGLPAPAGAVGWSWDAQPAPAPNYWKGVAYGGGKFVAVSSNSGAGIGDNVMTSSDGEIWTLQTAAADHQWNDVVFGGSLWVAVAESGAGDRVMTSPDAVTWTSQSSASNSYWMNVEYGNGTFVALAYGGQVMTSSDGATWTSQTPLGGSSWSGLTYAASKFVAVGDNEVATSPDGVTWTAQTPAGNGLWDSVAYGEGLFVAVAASADPAQRVMTSPDGVNWTLGSSLALAMKGITYGDGQFVAIGYNGSTGAMTSADGLTWVDSSGSPVRSWSAVAYGAGKFVAVSDDGYGDQVMTGAAPQGTSPRIGTARIQGTAKAGQTLTAVTGNVTGDPAPALSYEWQSSIAGGPWTAVPNATRRAFTVPASLGGAKLRVRVTATNGINPDAVKNSAAVAVPEVDPPTPAGDPSASVRGMKITLTWTPGTGAPGLPITDYAASCAQGSTTVRDLLPSTARKVTLTATAKGVWNCRVAAVSAAGRSATTPIRVGVA